MTLVGDVAGKVAIIVDDMADTCGTLVKAASVVREHGAVEAIAIVTHGIFSGNAIEALNGSQLRKIVVTNTIPCEDKMARCDRIALIDISPTVSLASVDNGTYTDCDRHSLPRRAGGRTTARVCRSCSNTRRWIRKPQSSGFNGGLVVSRRFGISRNR